MADGRKYMTVREMGNMLGLKKTERYWLVKKHYFKTETIAGKMRVDCASFYEWYHSQTWYRILSEEEQRWIASRKGTAGSRGPAKVRATIGAEAKENEAAELLDAVQSGGRVLDAVQAKPEITPLILPEEVKAMLEKEKNPELRDLRMQIIQKTGKTRNIGNLHFLNIREAALLAHVGEGTVQRWIKQGKFKTIEAGKVIRIPRAEFEAWLRKYKKGDRYGIDCRKK